MKYFFLSLALCLSAFFVSCSDDKPTSSNNNNNNSDTVKASDYFPMSSGKTYVYETVLLNNGNVAIDTTRGFDTTSVTRKISFQGYDSYEYVTRQSNGTYDTTYYYTSGSRLYSYFKDVQYQTFRFPLGKWVLIADFNQTSWKAFPDTSMKDADFPVLPGVKITATVSGTGQKGSSPYTSVINGANYTAQEFILKIRIAGTTNLMNIGIDTTRVIHYWLAKGAGITHKLEEAILLTPISGITFPLLGREAILRKFY